jgi:peptidoglycan/LPS O-acetylase OafA/YrhL
MTTLALLLMMFGHGPVLGAHTVVGILVFLLAIAAIFVGWARRVVLYALALQIAIGALAWATQGLQPPLLHWTLAVLCGGLYAMAGAAERRGRPAAYVRTLLIVAALVIGVVYYVGEHTLHAG